MTRPEPNTLLYAGIGSRKTPALVLSDITTMSSWLARTGWHLSSGGAHGADAAFAAGAPPSQRTIYLPWDSYNSLSGPDCELPDSAQFDACMAIASRLHPAWERCSPRVRLLHARNAAILLGTSLDRPGRRRRRLDPERRRHGRHRPRPAHRGPIRHPRAQSRIHLDPGGERVQAFSGDRCC